MRNVVDHLGFVLSITALGTLFVASGCGSGTPANDSTGGSGGSNVAGPPELAIVEAPPEVSNSEPDSKSYAFEGYATSLARLGSFAAIGTTLGVYEPDAAGGATLLPIVGDDPSLPIETGIVRAMVAIDGGVLVAADAGVFFTQGGVLQRSLASDALMPLGIEAMTARVADDDGDGTAESHVSILGQAGAYELGPDKLVTWKVEGEADKPSAIFAQKSRVLLAYGRRVYEIDKASGKAYPLVFDVGYVRAIACGSSACDEGSLLYFASDEGLVERSPSGQYTRYSLANEGQTPVGVQAFALDASKQRLYALAGEHLLRVRAGDVPEGLAMIGPTNSVRVLAVDKIGDVWMGEGQTARQFALGTPLSFLTDVKPIMHEYCADCHAAGLLGAPKIDFESYDVMLEHVDRVMKRVVDERSMPPPTYAKKVPTDSIAILKEWVISKAP